MLELLTAEYTFVNERLAAHYGIPAVRGSHLEEDNAEGEVLSMRDRMVQHRANPVCASCHAMMDPLGLALENFDAVGRWRTRSEAFTPIDASGATLDGAAFDGVDGLREVLLGRSELFVTTLTEKLLTYALGRGVESGDAPVVRQIVRAAGAEDYRFQPLLMGIVKSLPFQMRRSSGPPAVASAQ